MFNRYYQQELSYLRELAAAFSKAHPSLAPSLSGPSSDPDVERLLEGVAFSTGLLRQKLDDELPEIIHGLTDLVIPHYLRPIPSASVVTFIPKPALNGKISVPKGTTVASVPVEGTSCIFQTAFDIEAWPMHLKNAVISEESGRLIRIRLDLSLSGMGLNAWDTDKLRFYLGGEYARAADLYLLLNRYVRSISLSPKQGGETVTLGQEYLRPAGFAPHESLIPYPGQSFPIYRILQEYFLLPQKFLFLDLRGLDKWKNRGSGTEFEICFELYDPPFFPQQIRPDSFSLFTCPVVNIFRHSADPISLDHRMPEYPVRPSGKNDKHFQVYSIDNVTGIVQGTVQKKHYVPFELFPSQEEGYAAYQVVRKISPVDNRANVYLTLPYTRGAEPTAREILSIELSCTNGNLTENLQIGDISRPTSDSPILLDFKNILTVTPSVQPPLGNDALWRFLSHLSVNYLPLADARNLKEMLNLYIFPGSRDKARVAANSKRISGIENITVTPENRLISAYMMRGQKIRMDLRLDHFACIGDMFLFASVLNRFLSGYTSINTFTRLSVRDIISGEVYQWKPRIGITALL